MIGEQENKDNYVVVSVKLKPEHAELLNAICNALGVNTYQIFQMFFYTLTKAACPMHECSPEIRKLMTILENDVAWSDAFNMASSDALRVAQAILILEQEGHKGFGAVMIDAPMGEQCRQTWCVDDILERVTEVTMHGIYRRLRMLGAKMGCNNLSDVLLRVIETQTDIEMEEQSRVEMKGEALYDNRGRAIEYGKKTKAKQRRTPDSVANDRRMKWSKITFGDEDRDLAESELQDD